MSSKVKMLVVGLGNMGASHASAYHRMDGFEIAGLMSRSIKSKTIPDELSGYPLFEDFDEALSATKPDAVSINSWPNSHADYALRAMDAGRRTILKREGLDPRALIAAVDQGDELATEILEVGRNALAGLLIMVLTTIAPEAIVLAGGLCNESHFYVDPVIERVGEWLTIPELAEIPIRRATLWDRAVLYGAAELVRGL